ncbi:cytochrome C oxidase subunit IV family protein [Thalassomonas haliotis]|uniref:Cytochrome C oxidase subunit IV family protein n=1 Tax=Thalassomonas haliotis TaxID=485448 RepID=A0ABY7VIC2_9GAMM|nr:cytochrome C oxidase subunit IV family protein [Thalassomonas haliotis]WDE13459.1 cytochrome C oxidase subunit IV family protein [Thalassomonas haliotis]
MSAAESSKIAVREADSGADANRRWNKLDITWVVLMVVTLLNAFVAETADPHLLITFVICLSIAYKGRLVIDNFMELYHANKTIRSFMRSYFYVFPVLIFLADVFSAQIAWLTTIN